ncbi:hypothetical protein SESBI_18542 [Sesbania bispinosa]|nr:hypothetical protein SESBI_18542 [Sesbania bispinosa]
MIFCCGFDLSDFFQRESLFRSSESDPHLLEKQRSNSEKSASSSTAFSRRSLDAGGRMPRLVEFWTDAATDRRRRNSASSLSSSLQRFFEMLKS